MWYVYMICSATSPDQNYIGATADLKQRMADHNAGKSTQPPNHSLAVGMVLRVS